MNPLDRVLSEIQKKVELEGRSHSDCVFFQDLQVRVTHREASSSFPDGNDLPTIDQVKGFKGVISNVRDDENWRSAVLSYSGDSFFPSHCLSHQFIEAGLKTNLSVCFSEADVYNDLEKIVASSSKVLNEFCHIVGDRPGDITINIGCAYARYSDMLYVEEFTFEFGD